jgi:DNA-binding Lrp family transcriptional regulator
VFVHVTLLRQHKTSLDAVANAIVSRPEVVECYMMAGDSDFMLRAVSVSMDTYPRFIHECLSQIDGIANIRSSFALQLVKYSTALPTHHLRK